jgi:hypothetical protein
VKIIKLKLPLVITLIVFSFALKAQHLANKLYIHNAKNNSYENAVAFQPYAVLTNNNEILKGYFDAVYDETFLFATKDSLYVLKPDNIKGVVQIAGIGGNPNNYSKGGNIGLQVGGIAMITLGALFLPATIVTLTEGIGGGALALITGGLIGGGIAMVSTASKRRKNLENIDTPEETLRNSKNQLRIIKSPL